MKKILMTIIFCTAFAFAGNFLKPDESETEDSPDTVYVVQNTGYVVYSSGYYHPRPPSRIYYRHAPDRCVNRNCLHRQKPVRPRVYPPRILRPTPPPHRPGHRPPPPPPPKHHHHR